MRWRDVCYAVVFVGSVGGPALAGGVEKRDFGKLPDGRPVELYTLKNGALTAKVMTYGAIVTELHAPGRDGKTADVVLGFDDLDGYLGKHPYFGAVVGRFANRIAGGKFSLGGKEYSLARNDGENSLHGGGKGFDKVLWKAEEVKDKGGDPAVRFTYTSPDGEEGYPGNLDVAVTFTVTPQNELRIDYRATTDKATPVNLTHHGYFNLSGPASGPILDHVMMLPSEKYTPGDEKTMIPTGAIAPVRGTPFDFTTPTPIGARIDRVKGEPGGYDLNYVVLKEGDLPLAARVTDPRSGRVLEVQTSEPGVQFYTGNFLDGTIKGKGGVVYKKHQAFCLEAQHYPDSVHHPNFPTTVLEPGKVYTQTTVYRFRLTREPERGAARSGSVPAALRPFVESHALAGAVTLVADKDRVLGLDAVGFADVAAGKPMPTDALFWIASQSKPITASALMMLVDEGKVRLDDPVAKYLPEFRDQWLAAEKDSDHVLLRKPGHPVTVREILSHTSGMPFASALERPTLDGLPLRAAVASYAMTPLATEPGAKYQYSNAGINTAGRIIEVVGGLSYEEFLQTRLFDPLGMKDTTFRPDDRQLARLAKSYRPNSDGSGLEETKVGQLTYPLGGPGRHPMPAGGLFSTAADVGRFCRMILNRGTFGGKRYLSEAAVSEMTRKQTGDAIQEGYGLGWAVNGRTFGHGGAFATDMSIDPERGRVTVFLVQHAGFPGNGAQSLAAFRKAAAEQYGGPRN